MTVFTRHHSVTIFGNDLSTKLRLHLEASGEAPNRIQPGTVHLGNHHGGMQGTKNVI